MTEAEQAGYRSVIEIDDLGEVPDHRPTVADRLWHAWWKADGRSLADVEAALGEVLIAPGFPFTLVATHQGQFVGTVTAIQSDIVERPALGPCLAALWVEPGARKQGIAQQLTATVLDRLSRHGFGQVYLSARPHMHSFYQSRGWTQIENDVGDDRLGVFVRALP